MQRKLNQDDFEQFLRENADSLRIKPSPAVWNNISKELNRKKRRVAGLVVLALSLVSGSYFAWQTASDDGNASAVANTLKSSLRSQENHTANAESKLENNTEPTTAPVIALADRPRAGGTIKKNSATAYNTPKAVAETAAPDIALVGTLNSVAEASHNEIAEPEIPVRLDQSAIATLPQEKTSGILPEVSGKATNTTATDFGTESVTASIRKKERRLNWNIFVTPTVSYRKLSENKGFQRPFLTPGTPPTVSALYHLKDAVMHKPDLGLEFGAMARYSLTRNIRLRTGFQFNISRYDIRAFSYVPEVATIALNNGFRVDSVRAISNYRNFNGGGTNWLQNFYFQASVPVGLEVNLISGKKAQLGVASSIQPTYIIGNRAYLITADYKNYARIPWLSRRWNVNTSFEAFTTFNSGKTQWQVGPQVRYQLLSSFVNEYPVKENLFDFGMKVGVTLR